MHDFKSRLNLLKMLYPISFYSIKKSETMDSLPLTTLIQKLDRETKSFFDAICMLAFADIPENISLGGFIRTIIRANPFREGTSEFSYPQEGGYDQISKLHANYITSNGSDIMLSSAVKKIIIVNGKVNGIITNNDELIETDVCIISVPVYNAINTFFDKGAFEMNM